MYFDIGQQKEVESAKIEATLQHAKGGVLIEMDCNSMSGSWQDSTRKQAVEI